MCVNNLSKVALHSAAAGIEPAISSRKSKALTTTAPSHILYLIANDLSKFRRTRTGVVEYLDAAVEVDVLEHVVDFDVAAGERRSSGGNSDRVDTRRGAKHQSDADRYRGYVDGLRADDTRLATRDVLDGYRERAVRQHVPRSGEYVLAVTLQKNTLPSWIGVANGGRSSWGVLGPPTPDPVPL